MADRDEAAVVAVAASEAQSAPPSDAPLADVPVELEIVSSERVFAGKVWDVRREAFRLGSDTIVREFVDHPGAVAVFAVDEADRVLVIQQYRHPVRMRDWELPAGLLDVAGEDPAETARRELAEEADLQARHWSPLLSFLPTPGGNSEVIRIFEARGIEAAPEIFERRDEEAEIVTRWVPFAELLEAALAGRIRNAILVLAVLTAHARRSA